MRTFILLSAMPGSGKSTWAHLYQKEHENVVIVSSDDIREQLNGDPSDVSNDANVWIEYRRQIIDYAKEENVTVIADSTNLSNKYRIYYAKEAAPLYDKLILVRFDVSYEVCQKRNLGRFPGRVVPEFAMKSLREEYEDPSKEALSLYDQVFVVDEHGGTTRIK